jgi:septum formation protein
MRFILASSSPRRRELIASLGIDFEIIKPEIDETLHEDETPLEYVRRLSAEKAEAVASQLESSSEAMILAADTIVLAADTIGVIEGEMTNEKLLGKPADADEARAMLRLLRQQPHQVYTAFRLLKLRRDSVSDKILRGSIGDLVRTTVTMRLYSDDEIEAYIASGDPFDKAGGYAIQNAAFHPVASIDGCYNNVVGLPLCEVKWGLYGLDWPGIDPPDYCDCPLYEPYQPPSV